MIILLTGKPGVGKSTVIEKLLAAYTKKCTWVLTKGIPRPKGGRAGFEAFNSAGEAQVISHKTDIASDVIIGENHVDLAAVDAMFARALQNASSKTLTIVDEIGPIQLLSPTFRQSLAHAFHDRVNLIATIHYDDARLEKYRQFSGAALIEVTTANRDALPAMLEQIARCLDKLTQLNPSQQAIALGLFKEYATAGRAMAVQKLTHNALSYVGESKVNEIDDSHWQVKGHHGQYNVQCKKDGFTCECDLFNGRGVYSHPEECSHIQAVKLYLG